MYKGQEQEGTQKSQINSMGVLQLGPWPCIMFGNGYMFVKFGNIREGPNYRLYDVLGFEYKEGVLVPLEA